MIARQRSRDLEAIEFTSDSVLVIACDSYMRPETTDWRPLPRDHFEQTVVLYESLHASVIAQQLEASTPLKSVGLVGFDLTDADIARLAPHLAHARHLDLEGNRLTHTGVRTVVEAAPYLESISLASNGLSSFDVEPLGQARRLRNLNLHSNRIDDGGVQAIAGAMSGLDAICVSSNRFGTDGGEVLCEHLSDLAHLDIDRCRTSSEQIERLLRRSPNLVYADLSGSKLSQAALRSICTNASLRHLMLNDARLDSVQDLQNELASSNLVELEGIGLSGTLVNDSTASTLANALPSVREADLSHCKLSGVGVSHLVQGMRCLEFLNLDGSTIGTKGARSLQRSELGLRRLWMWGAGVPEADARKLVESLPSLTSIGFGNCGLSPAFFESLADSLPMLREVLCRGNAAGDEGMRAIGALRELEVLDLGANGITGSSIEAILQLRELGCLHLGDNGLGVSTSVSKLFTLPWLYKLDLRRNGLESIDIPQRPTAELAPLWRLWVPENSLDRSAAESISTFSDLRTLDLNGARLGDDGVATLTNGLHRLTTLSLADNDIDGPSAVAIATNCPRLRYLDLDNNRLTDDGAQDLSDLQELESLYLESNDVRKEGALALATRLPRLENLNLRRNAVEGVADLSVSMDQTARQRANSVPAELFNITVAEELRAALELYSNDDGPMVPLNEAKLLVVGNEGFGKTSLVRYLTSGKPRRTSQSQTEGIEVTGWSPLGAEGPLINIWDFGGQEIQRQTHRFFLSERSLFVVVLSARYEDDMSVWDWLRTIESRAPESPVLVVINMCDNGSHSLAVDIGAVRRSFQNVIAVHETSCDESDLARASIDALRVAILKTLMDDPRLAALRDPVPAAWDEVKHGVRAGSQMSHVMRSADFVSICERAGVTDQHEQRSLLRFLNEMGVVVAHGLDANSPAVFRDITLLDPNWLTQALHRIVDRARESGKGEFRPGELQAVLDPERYPPSFHEFILAMLSHEEFGLAFRSDSSQGATFVVPSSLPPNSPDYDDWPAHSLHARYRYGLLPRELIPRFIATAHRSLTTNRTCWLTGAVLEYAGCRVLVEGDLFAKTVDVRISGEVVRRRTALALLTRDFDDVHHRYPESKPLLVVPLPGSPALDVEEAHLRRLEAAYGGGYRFIPQGSDVEYSVSDLLHGEGRSATSQDLSQEAVAAGNRRPSRWWESWWWGAAVAFALAVVFMVWIAFADGLLTRLILGTVGAGVVGGLLFTLFRDPRYAYRRAFAGLALGGPVGAAALTEVTASVETNDSSASIELANGGSNTAWIAGAWLVAVLACVVGDVMTGRKD